jgi:hypothetical protein
MGGTSSVIGSGALALFLAVSWASLYAQGAPDILHEPFDCVDAGEYLVVGATIQPSSEIRAAKVYFRSDKYPKFYFVEMSLEGSTFRAVLPKPSPETEHIIYYIEALDRSFNNTMSAEQATAVEQQCDERDPAAIFAGEDPGIIVGAIESGAPVLPSGFETVGIIGTLSSTGLLSGVGGGPGVGTAVAIGSAAAGAGGLVVAASGPTESTTTTPSAVTPETTTSTASPATVPGTTTTTAAPTPGPSNSTTTTTTEPGSTTTAVTTTTTAVTTTTTAPPSTTTTPATLTACFTASDSDGASGCKVSFDASCSSGDIVTYTWRFQDNPPATVSGPSETASYDWSSDPACGGPFTRLVRLTVASSDNKTDQAQANINPNGPGLTAPLRTPMNELQSSFTSYLLFPPSQGRLESRVNVNGIQLDVTDNSAPYTHRTNGKRDWNTVEGYFTSGSTQPVFWRFDFAASENFSPGSLRVETGVVASQETYSIVFRLSGDPGERVKFTYRLSPGRQP